MVVMGWQQHGMVMGWHAIGMPIACLPRGIAYNFPPMILQCNVVGCVPGCPAKHGGHVVAPKNPLKYVSKLYQICSKLINS